MLRSLAMSARMNGSEEKPQEGQEATQDVFEILVEIGITYRCA